MKLEFTNRRKHPLADNRCVVKRDPQTLDDKIEAVVNGGITIGELILWNDGHGRLVLNQKLCGLTLEEMQAICKFAADPDSA